MKKTVFILALGAVVILFLSGCASVFSKSKYDVVIQSNAPKAKVKIQESNSGAILVTGTCPCSVNLNASKGFLNGASYIVEVYTPEKKRQYRTINASVDPWVFGNFLLGGIIGLAIDGATGAMFKLEDVCYVHFSEYDTDNHEIDDNNTIQAIEQKAVAQEKNQKKDKENDTKKVVDNKTN